LSIQDPIFYALETDDRTYQIQNGDSRLMSTHHLFLNRFYL